MQCCGSLTQWSCPWVILQLPGGSVHLDSGKFSWNRGPWGCWIPWCLLNASHEARGCRGLWLGWAHPLWDREFAQLAALGLPRTLSKGPSGLAVGRSEAVSCCVALLSSLVSWRGAVMKALSTGLSRERQR